MKQLALVIWMLGWPLVWEINDLVQHHIGQPYTQISNGASWLCLGFWFLGSVVVYDKN